MLKKADIKYTLLGIAWSTVIFILCSIPGKMVPNFNIWSFLSFDKLAHCSVFLIHTLLWILAFRKQFISNFLRLHAIWLSCVIGMIYGVGLEFWQSTLSNGRVADLADMIANAIGCILGSFFYPKLIKWKLFGFLNMEYEE